VAKIAFLRKGGKTWQTLPAAACATECDGFVQNERHGAKGGEKAGFFADVPFAAKKDCLG